MACPTPSPTTPSPSTATLWSPTTPSSTRVCRTSSPTMPSSTTASSRSPTAPSATTASLSPPPFDLGPTGPGHCPRPLGDGPWPGRHQPATLILGVVPFGGEHDAEDDATNVNEDDDNQIA